MEKYINLQLFAEAGTLVNASGNYINAYTGDVTAFAGNDTMAPTLKTFYDTELLENARSKLVFTQFGKKQALPKGRGKTVEWRKWNTLEKAMTPLTEGVIPTGKKFGQTSINVSISQHGDYVAVTDVLELHATDDVILGATEEEGAAAGATMDTLVRNELATGTNVIFADSINTGSSDAYVSTPASRAALSSAAATFSKFTPDMVNKAATLLKKLKAPTFDGYYVAVIHPSVAYDLRNATEWKEFHKYSDAAPIFRGEIGTMHGVRFVETTEAPVLNGEDLASDSRTLTINLGAGYTAANSVVFDGGTVEADALIGRYVIINGTKTKVTDNTTTGLTLETAVTCSDNAVIYPGEGGAAGAAVYLTMFFGKGAYGLVDPDGAGLEMIVHSKNEIGGPLNQFSTVGYKFSHATKILYQDRMVRVESTSSYSGTDEAN